MLSRHCYFLHDCLIFRWDIYLGSLTINYGWPQYIIHFLTQRSPCHLHVTFSSMFWQAHLCHFLFIVLTLCVMKFYHHSFLKQRGTKKWRSQSLVATFKYSSQCHMIIIAPMISLPMTLLTNMFAITIMNDWNSDKISCVLHPNNYVLKSYHGLIESWMKNHLAN